MTRKTAALSVVASLAVLAAGGAVVTAAAAPGGSSHKHPNVQTLHYTARTADVFHVDKRDRVSTDNLYSRHLASAGHPKGVAVFTCHLTSASASSVHCRSALALKGGFMFGTATVSYTSFKLNGRITSGNGIYRGATGTIHAVPSTGRHSVVTLKYRITH